MEAHNRDTNDAEDHVDDDDRSSNMVLVAGPTCCVHEDRRKRIGWSHETLRSADRESHVLRQDNGQKVCKRVCDSRGVEEDLNALVADLGLHRNTKSYHGKSPNLDVQTSTQKLLQIPWLRLRVTTISVDRIDDELGLALVEEVERGVGLIGEIDDCPIANDTHEDRQSSFDDEDPAPSFRKR